MKKLRILLLALSALAAFTASAASAVTDALVTTAWAAENAENPKVRLIEVSVEPGLYEQGHIPGAFNISWHTDLVDTVRRDIISKAQFEALASRLGLTPDTTVVLYGDHNNWFAAWGAWIFTTYGHADVRLLDGGRKKWELERRPYATVPPAARATTYTVQTTRPELRARLAEVVAVAEGEKSSTLVDIRSPDEFQGRVIAPAGIQELAIRAGHVPGAINVPWTTSVNPADGTFLPAAELKKVYAAKGVDGAKPTIVYCRIGERSAHTWFVLHRLLGYEVKQYDGSWTEYGNAVGVPITNPSGLVWTGK